MRRRTTPLMLTVALLFAFHVQAGSGSLKGTVRLDGARAAGVSIVAEDAHGKRYSTVSDERGRYALDALPDGAFAVTFEREGVQAVTHLVKVSGDRSVVDAELKSEAVAEAITVTAAAPAIVETNEVHATYEADFVDRLPTARTLQATALLAPGVTDTGFGFRGRNNFLVISGAPASDNL